MRMLPLIGIVAWMSAGCAGWQSIKDNDEQFALIKTLAQEAARAGTATLLERDEAEIKVAQRVETGATLGIGLVQTMMDGTSPVMGLQDLLDAIDVNLDDDEIAYIEVGLTAACGYVSGAVGQDGNLDEKDLSLIQAALVGVRKGAQDYQVRRAKEKPPC